MDRQTDREADGLTGGREDCWADCPHMCPSTSCRRARMFLVPRNFCNTRRTLRLREYFMQRSIKNFSLPFAWQFTCAMRSLRSVFRTRSLFRYHHCCIDGRYHPPRLQLWHRWVWRPPSLSGRGGSIYVLFSCRIGTLQKDGRLKFFQDFEFGKE